MSQTAEIQSTGLGDTLTKGFKKFGVTRLVEAVQIWAGYPPCAEKGVESKCAVRARLLNELISYNKVIKVRFLKDWQKRENVSRGTSPTFAITYSAKAGDEAEVKKGHPAYPLLLWLAQSNIVEEVT